MLQWTILDLNKTENTKTYISFLEHPPHIQTILASRPLNLVLVRGEVVGGGTTTVENDGEEESRPLMQSV